jgi:hypothetical protein
VSVVHGFPSLQSGGGPATQLPPAQTSPVEQALPSLHGRVLFVWRQPATASQLSVVQGFPSLQLGAAPPTQAPPAHRSFVVQASPSLQAAVLLAWRQPEAGLQLSSVQGFPSLQLGAAPPTQVPATHRSPVVQASSSLHAAVLF